MYIGIDLGGTNIAVGLVNGDGKIIAKDSTPTIKERHYSEIVADMARICKEVVVKGGYSMADIKAIGIGCPGTIDAKNGVVVYSNNIIMHNVPIVEELKKHIELPISIVNDADAAALGEYAAYGEDADSFVLITLGTGVGSGIVLGGKIWNGFNFAGGEIGHATLIHNGRKCTCGRRGCIEAYASVTALIEQTKEKMSECPDSMMHAYVAKTGHINGRVAFECAKRGDTAAIEVRDTYINYIADSVASIINILQPKLLVIGGGISREGDVILNPIKEYLESNDYNKYMPKCDVRIAKLFGDAGIVGAAMSAKMSISE